MTALDITPALVEVGERNGRRRGLEIEWLVGNAQELPFADGSFDIVLSAVSVMFAPDHRRAQWGVASHVAELLDPGCGSVVSVERSIDARFDGSARALIDHYREHFAPVLVAYQQLEGVAGALAALDRDLVDWTTRLYQRPPAGRYRYEYLQTVAIRR